jgi:hypothetical protein
MFGAAQIMQRAITAPAHQTFLYGEKSGISLFSTFLAS